MRTVQMTLDDDLVTTVDRVANCDHVQTVAKGRMGALITTLPAAKLAAVSRALRFALNL